MRAQWAIATRKHPAVAAAAAAAAAVQGCGRAAANRVAHHQLNQGRQLAARRRSGKVAFKGPKPVAVSDGACVHVTCGRNAVGGGRRDPQAARLAAQGGGRGGIGQQAIVPILAGCRARRASRLTACLRPRGRTAGRNSSPVPRAGTRGAGGSGAQVQAPADSEALRCSAAGGGRAERDCRNPNRMACLGPPLFP